MRLDVFREYQGSSQLVGHFSELANSSRQFTYDRDYLASPAAHALSHSLPLREDPFAHDEYQGFFEGMIPEGPMRTELAYQFHLPPSDYIGLLSRLGSECVGALLFKEANTEIESPSYEIIDEIEFGEILSHSFLQSSSILRSTRLSLAGAQTKFGVYIDPDEKQLSHAAWYKPFGTAPSTHIVKVADERIPNLSYNELACMTLARQCGLLAADVCITPENPSVLIVRRFDRVFEESCSSIDGHRAPKRLHQEDFCQSLGWGTYLKYELSDMIYARLSRQLIERISADVIADRHSFAQRVVFDYLIGNCDNHLKNHGFLYSADWEEKRLAPVYDVVSTTLLGFDRKMGFSIGDHIVIDEISLEDWTKFADDIKLQQQEMQEILGGLAAKMPTALEQVAELMPKQGQEQLELIAKDMKPRLHLLLSI